MVVHTDVDQNCIPQLDPKTRKPIVDFYWLMDGKTFKPVNPLIKNGIRDRIQALSSLDRTNIFFIDLLDLSEVKIDLPESQLTVEVFKNTLGHCEARSTIELGKSDENITLLLHTIYVEAKRTLNPFSPKVNSITLKGIDLTTGLRKSRTYSAHSRSSPLEFLFY